MATTAFSHLGICVSDLERSVAFYCDGLGFERAEAHEVGAEFGALMELDGLRLRSQFLRGPGGVALELLAFASPAPTGDGRRRPLNALGLTHLSVRVDDVDAVAARLVALGGAVVDGTRTTIPTGGRPLDFVYLTDPDGVRIELMDLGR